MILDDVLLPYLELEHGGPLPEDFHITGFCSDPDDVMVFVIHGRSSTLELSVSMSINEAAELRVFERVANRIDAAQTFPN